MKVIVRLDPEMGFRHFGSCAGRTIELEPAYQVGLWWARFIRADGQRWAYLEPVSAGYLGDRLREEGYDLRYISWCETPREPHKYNPFFGRQRTADESKNVYFAFNPKAELIKIGYSVNYIKRIEQLSTQSRIQLQLLGLIAGGYDVEKWVHQELDEHRVVNEWFKDCDPVRQFVTKHTYLP